MQAQTILLEASEDWPSIVASSALVRASDALSQQRSLGVVFLSTCHVSHYDLSRFFNFDGSFNGLITYAITYDPQVGSMITELFTGTPADDNITMLINSITSESFEEICANLGDTARANAITIWRNDVEYYIHDVIDHIRSIVIALVIQVGFITTFSIVTCVRYAILDVYMSVCVIMVSLRTNHLLVTETEQILWDRKNDTHVEKTKIDLVTFNIIKQCIH
jgi:hypothetical protein